MKERKLVVYIKSMLKCCPCNVKSWVCHLHFDSWENSYSKRWCNLQDVMNLLKENLSVTFLHWGYKTDSKDSCIIGQTSMNVAMYYATKKGTNLSHLCSSNSKSHSRWHKEASILRNDKYAKSHVIYKHKKFLIIARYVMFNTDKESVKIIAWSGLTWKHRRHQLLFRSYARFGWRNCTYIRFQSCNQSYQVVMIWRIPAKESTY
jgi:hypothetical protein